MASITLVEGLDSVSPVHAPKVFFTLGTMNNIFFDLTRAPNTNSYSLLISSAGKAIFPVTGYTTDGAHSPIYASSGTLLVYVNTTVTATVTIHQTDTVGALTPEINVAEAVASQAGIQLGSSWVVTRNGQTVTFAYIVPFDPTIEVRPLDTEFIAPTEELQDTLTSTQIRRQEGYIAIDDSSHLLHSAMKNAFFLAFTREVVKELQNQMDMVNPLKSLYDIDYYDGDQLSFSEKINNLGAMFGFSIPQFFLSRTNVENGDDVDLNKQNDFLRNIVKRMWLTRRWAGTIDGYQLPIRLINRVGTVHLALLYPPTSTVTSSTGKAYRLLDRKGPSTITPGGAGSSFPNSGNLVGARSFAEVKPILYQWDVGNTFDQSPPIALFISPGSTGIVFSSVTLDQSAKKATFSVLSAFGATPGYITVAGSSIYIPYSLITNPNATQVIASYIASSLSITSGWSTAVSGATLTLTYTKVSQTLWDQSIPFVPSGRALMLEITLDRILRHTNSIGTKESLMDTLFFEAVDMLSGSVRRAQDIVYIGSQVSLVTGKDGSYNSLSYDPTTNPTPTYTHANIQAKFQVFSYLPDKVTPAWTSGSRVSYLKLGTGGYGDPEVDNLVFVDHLMSPRDPSRLVLSDLKNPVFKTQIGQNEKDRFGLFHLFNVVLHPRKISGTSRQTIFMNGVSTSPEFLQGSIIPLGNDYITSGTASVGVNIDLLVADLSTGPSVNVTLGNPLVKSQGVWTITVVGFVSGALTGSVEIQGKTVTLGAVDMVSKTTIAAKISSQLFFGDYTCSSTGEVLTFVANTSSLHQRAYIHEQYNPFASTFDPIFKYQELGSDQKYHDFIDNSSLSGYTKDASYAGVTVGYLPIRQRNAVTLAPLLYEDKYPKLISGLVAKYTLNDGNYGNITDYSFNYSTGQLNGNQGTSSNLGIEVASNIGFTMGSLTGVSFKRITSISTRNQEFWYVDGTASNTGTIYLCGLTITITLGATPQQIAAQVANLGARGKFRFSSVSSNPLGVTISPTVQFGVSIPDQYAVQMPPNNSLAFNGLNSYMLVPPSSSLNSPTTGVGPFTYSMFFQTTGSSLASSYIFSKTNGYDRKGYCAYLSEVNLNPLFYIAPGSNDGSGNELLGWNDLGVWTDTQAWSDSNTTSGTAKLFFIAYITNNGVLTQEGWSTHIPIDPLWHHLTLSFDWVHSPFLAIDGVPFIFEGTTIPVDGVSVFQTNDSSDPLLFGAGFSGVSDGILDATGAWQDIGVWLDSENWVDNASPVLPDPNSILDTNGLWTDAGVWSDVGTWAERSALSSFLGNLAEIRVFNKSLTEQDSFDLYQSSSYHNSPLLDSTGGQGYAFIDHRTGNVIIKAQYNPNGPMSALSQAQTSYSGLTTSVSQSYELGTSSSLTAISEMGLFDEEDHLVAYATFPPIIYDSSKYHTAFNILVAV